MNAKNFSIGAVITILLGAFFYKIWVVQPKEDAKQRQRYDKDKVAASQRFTDWAYIAKSKEIAPGETVKLVVIPGTSPYASEVFDTKCLVYTHREFKTSSMICPDAKQAEIQISEE